MYFATVPSSGSARIRQLPHLDNLVLCEGWHEHFSATHLPHDLKRSNIKQLHIGSPCADIISLCITPTFIGVLTHLSLRTITQDTISPSKIILRYGAKLQSLRIKGQLQAVYVQSLQGMTVQCSSPGLTNKFESAYRIRVGEFTYHFGSSPNDPFDDTPRARFACIPSRVYCITHFTLPESILHNSQISSEDSHMRRRQSSR
jgi:hypothetical protein